MSDDNELFIRNELIPLLISQGKLTAESKNEKHPNDELPILKSVIVNNLNSKDTFMLTMCYRVIVETEENGKTCKHSLIVKKTPHIPKEMYDATGFENLFLNEILSYTKILPAIGDIGKYAKYYYSQMDEANALIVLSDFSVNGWKMSEARYNLSMEHVLLAVQCLGKFHGEAYALKLTSPEKFQSLVHMFKQSRFVTDPPEVWGKILKWSYTRLCNNFNSSDISTKVPKQFIENLENILMDYVNLAKMMFKPVEPFAIICHGDYLRNNIAFKYHDRDPELPIDVLMFDFQTIVYASPMVDLATFMGMSAGSNARSDNFELVFKAYWNSLIATTCSSGNLQADNLPEFMNYKNMLREYIKYFPLGIRIASFFLMEMVEPLGVPPDAFIADADDTELLLDVMNRGGEDVNGAVKSMVLELYNITQKYQVNVFEHFDRLKDL